MNICMHAMVERQVHLYLGAHHPIDTTIHYLSHEKFRLVLVQYVMCKIYVPLEQRTHLYNYTGQATTEQIVNYIQPLLIIIVTQKQINELVYQYSSSESNFRLV